MANVPFHAIMGYHYSMKGGVSVPDREKGAKRPLVCGLLAHVDAGKTTLSEGLLYVSGARRVLGRVDHGDAFLDSFQLERQRGITIFSKQARLETAHRMLTLVDTPGHVDFSAEAERVLPVLDCAVLVISGTDGVQAHTRTLWGLLERYQVPTFLFVNKMDLPGAEKDALLASLQQLSPGCVDFTQDMDALCEAAALCDEALLESYLSGGAVTPGNLRQLIRKRKLFPCYFGAALKLEGISALLEGLDTYGPEPEYPQDFSARVFKITRDPQGNRLTWMKLTGGSLAVRTPLTYQNRSGETVTEKPVQLRLYSGEKFEAQDRAEAGALLAATGLTATWAGQGLGAAQAGQAPLSQPVMTYRVQLPAGADPAVVLPKLRQLEEEDPQLHIAWDGKQIQVQIMGQVQLEIFRSLVRQRFGLDISLEDPQIFYKETITNTVEGVGHFEPLRHYAEVHLLLEPGEPGSGLVFDTVCPQDVLEPAYQSLVLTHLAEKQHRGVLIGAPITDMKITLLVGKAHVKHTEGGDFRQATYRALRQGLMEADSQLLEPWYDFRLELPQALIGRGITDIRAMGGQMESPQAKGETSILEGQVPASEIRDYAAQVAAYSQGQGKLSLSLHGYAPCHNAQKVIAAAAYDPEADTDNTPDSVFCSHGAGHTVKWNRVKEFMHLESGLQEEKPPQLRQLPAIDDQELERIMEREFGPIRRRQYAPPRAAATEEVIIRQPKEKCLIVDGYNMIFAWKDLAETAQSDLSAARRHLCDRLTSYAAFTKCRLILVFDSYRQPGSEKYQDAGIQVVFTQEGQTADAYIQSLAAQFGGNYRVSVASSDGMIQLSALGSGVLRVSARELEQEVRRAAEAMKQYY